MAVTMITNRGTLTVTWIRRLPKPSASNVRHVKVDSPGPQVKVSHVRPDRRAIRIRHAQRGHHASLVRHRIRQCLQVNPVR